jgi:HJR/Mrr/RecB family endonuclease
MSQIDELRKQFFDHIIKLKNLAEKEFKNKDEFNKTLLGIEEVNDSISGIEKQMLTKIISVRNLENEIEKLGKQINGLKNNKNVLENEINRLNIEKAAVTRQLQTMSKGQIHSFLLISYLTEFGFNHLDPLKFEELILNIFQVCGFKGELTPVSGDEGIDIQLVDPTGIKGIVQCKRYADDQPISPKDVREFLGSMVHAGAEYVIFPRFNGH